MKTKSVPTNTNGINPSLALALSTVVTCATLFGIATGKKIDKTALHLHVPYRRRLAVASEVI